MKKYCTFGWRKSFSFIIWTKVVPSIVCLQVKNRCECTNIRYSKKEPISSNNDDDERLYETVNFIFVLVCVCVCFDPCKIQITTRFLNVVPSTITGVLRCLNNMKSMKRCGGGGGRCTYTDKACMCAEKP